MTEGNRMRKIISIIVLFSLEMYSQSFRLGFDFEALIIRVNHHAFGGEGGMPIGYHLNFAYSPVEKFLVQANVGRTLLVEFGGFEFGIAGRYKFYNPFYASAGIQQHLNEGGASSNKGGNNYASISLLFAAAGVEAGFFSIQLGYYRPTAKKVISYSWSYDHTTIYLYYVTSMIRLSFIFSWEI